MPFRSFRKMWEGVMKLVQRALPEGVALILVNPEGKILVLQERVSKPWLGKYKGMFSIPMETKRPRDSDEKALKRLVVQELDGLQVEIEPEARGKYQVVLGVWAWVYAGTTRAMTPPQTNGSREVGDHAWVDAEKALELWLRQGAEEMITDYLAGKRGAERTFCKPARRQPSDARDL